MDLGGQADRPGERGYAMAALLVALAIMAILLTIAMPVWRHEAQREKEAELIYRGEQYARAIALYRAKNGNQLPPSIDVLVQGRYLRKKYKDPMTKDGEFMPIAMAQNTGGVPQPGPGRGGARGTPSMQPPVPQPTPPQPGGPGIAIGGIQGVRSKSEENSIRSYRGATRYDQWAFLANNVQRPGGMPMGNQSPTPGQIGGRGPNRGNTPNRPGGGSPTGPATVPPGGGRGPGRGVRGGGF
jgi:type II secretory pathway pseudopilin PulG